MPGALFSILFRDVFNMPVVAEFPYPSAEAVMNRARAYVNDSFQGGAGRILTDSAPFTIEYLNGALENLQDRLRDYGVMTLVQDGVILTPIVPVVQIDPSIQVAISYTGYFNGSINYASPVLPQNLITPLRIWERLTGSNNDFVPMQQVADGLASTWQGNDLCSWEWIGDQIVMPGALTTRDLRIRFTTVFTPILAGTVLSTVQIGVQASVEQLAWLVAYKYAMARGSVQTPALKAEANEKIMQIIRRYVREKASAPSIRHLYGEEGAECKIWPGI